MGNNLSSFTADDLQIQLQASQKLINELIELIQNEAEQKAKILIKSELLKLPPSVTEKLKNIESIQFEANQNKPGFLDRIKLILSDDVELRCSYKKLTNEEQGTGLMEFYLSNVVCFKFMSTAAEVNVMIELAKIDLQRDTES